MCPQATIGLCKQGIQILCRVTRQIMLWYKSVELCFVSALRVWNCYPICACCGQCLQLFPAALPLPKTVHLLWLLSGAWDAKHSTYARPFNAVSPSLLCLCCRSVREYVNGASCTACHAECRPLNSSASCHGPVRPSGKIVWVSVGEFSIAINAFLVSHFDCCKSLNWGLSFMTTDCL